MNNKGVDLKIYIDDDFLNWFNSEINFFYAVSTTGGEIISYSDNINKLTGMDSSVNVIDTNLKNIIGNENWQTLSREMSTKNFDREFFELQPLNDNSQLHAKWKKKKFDDREVVFFIFRIMETEAAQLIDIVEDKKEQTSGQFDFINMPAAVFNNKEYLFKSNLFDNIIKNININDFTGFKEWLNSNLKINIFGDKFFHKYFDLKILNDSYIVYLSDFINDREKFFIIFVKLDEKFFTSTDSKLTGDIEAVKLEYSRENEELIIKNTRIKTEIENFYQNFQTLYVAEQKVTEEKVVKNDINTLINITSADVSKLRDLTGMIEEISIQIHLISINAAIESARLGETGKGFAVISKEIAKLSDFTKNYTKMLNSQINTIIENIDKNLKKMSNDNFKDQNNENKKVINNLKNEIERLKSVF